MSPQTGVVAGAAANNHQIGIQAGSSSRNSLRNVTGFQYDFGVCARILLHPGQGSGGVGKETSFLPLSQHG